MLIPILAGFALMLTEAPAAAPAATPAPVAVNPVTAEINALLEPYKGKSGDRLRGLLGFSSGVRAASDGEVVFWMINVEQETTCGVDPSTMAMRCIRGDPFQCRLAIAFDKQGVVKAWAVTGEPEICRGFVGKLKAR